jgi:HlyD family secretion protein
MIGRPRIKRATSAPLPFYNALHMTMTRLIVFFSFTILFFGCTKNDRIIHPEQKPLMEAVYATGHIVAKDEYEVISQAEGYVLEKVIEDGGTVSNGSPLFILESGQQSSRFDLAKKSYAIASTNYRDDSPVLKEIVATLQVTQTRMKFDSINHARYENLLSKGATSQGEYDRVRLAYDNTRAEYLLQQSRYEQIKNRLFLELENARSQLAIAGNEAGKSIIKSEAEGRVFRTLKEKGELVRRGEPVAIVGNQNTFYLQLLVDELDIRRLQRDQEVLVTVDAIPNSIFKAIVHKIYPIVNRQQQSIRVDASLQDTLPVLFSGLAVEANIIIKRTQNALVIPRSALVGKDSLWVKTKNGNEKIRVQTGIQTLEEVEILQGLEPTSEIVISQ